MGNRSIGVELSEAANALKEKRERLERNEEDAEALCDFIRERTDSYEEAERVLALAGTMLHRSAKI